MHCTLQKKLLVVPCKKQLQIELQQYHSVLLHVMFKKIVLMHAKKTGAKILVLIQCVQTVQIWLQRGEKLNLYPTGNAIVSMNIALNMVLVMRRYEGEEEGLWLHCVQYSGPGWIYECPYPEWASLE